jgi:hypothetical protein
MRVSIGASDTRKLSRRHVAITAEQREVRNLKRHLRLLSAAVKVSLDALDETMTKAPTHERGRRVASICNGLDMARQMADRFGLGKRK